MGRSCYSIWTMCSIDQNAAIDELLEKFAFIPNTNNLLARSLQTREQAGATIISTGIAFPHCRSILVDDFKIVIGRAVKGIKWPDQKVKLIILMISPVNLTGPKEHMKLIKHFVKCIREHGLEGLMKSSSAEELVSKLGFIPMDKN